MSASSDKSLSKKKDDRYQSLKDMLIDLKRLKRQLELEEDLVDLPEAVSGRPSLTGCSGAVRVATGEQRAATKEVTIREHASSAAYIVNGLRKHKKIALIAIAVVITAVVGITYYMLSRPIDSIAVLPFNSVGSETGMDQLGDDIIRTEYASALALSGVKDRAQKELNELIELSKQRYVSPYQIAVTYVSLKDNDHAFEWLEKAFRERADWMVFLNVDPRFDGLHSDPRFIDLQRDINLR